MNGVFPSGTKAITKAKLFVAPQPTTPAVHNSWPIFPTLPGQAFPIHRKMEWRTRLRVSMSGKDSTMPDWSLPNYTWMLVHNVLRQGIVNGSTQNEMRQLFAFFARCHGAFSTFFYQDGDDYQTVNELLGTGNGVTLAFPLVRTFGGAVERVFAPNLNAIPLVYVNGRQAQQSSYTITPWTTTNAAGAGVLLFSAPPIGPVSISFYYYWPCRFIEDQCSFEKFLSGYYKLAQLAFENDTR